MNNNKNSNNKNNATVLRQADAIRGLLFSDSENELSPEKPVAFTTTLQFDVGCSTTSGIEDALIARGLDCVESLLRNAGYLVYFAESYESAELRLL